MKSSNVCYFYAFFFIYYWFFSSYFIKIVGFFFLQISEISQKSLKWLINQIFKIIKIVTARKTGAAKTAELFVVGSTVSKVTTVFEKERKTSSLEQNCRWKQKLSDKDCRTPRRIVRKDPKNTAAKMTAELNDHLEMPVSSKMVKKGAAQSLISREGSKQENYIEINLFEISRCFHYFAQTL